MVGWRQLWLWGALSVAALLAAALLFWPDPPAPLEVDAAFSRSVVAAARDLDRAPADTEEALASLNAMWERVFERAGHEYEPPEVESFLDASRQICGDEAGDVAGLYCGEERRIYLSEEWRAQLDAADWAYIVAHEVGHHVQELRGTVGTFEVYRIAHELQADCYAGVWGAAAGLDPPSPAFYSADDRLTHGTAGQQREWVLRGHESRRPGRCAS